MMIRARRPSRRTSQISSQKALERCRQRALERCRQALQASDSIIGRWRRFWAASTLARYRDDPEFTPILVDALRSPHEQVVAFALGFRECPRGQEAIDRLCEIWVRTREAELGTLIARHRFIASRPVRVRVLSALRAGDTRLPDQVDGSLLEHVVAGLDYPDEQVRAQAEVVLASLTQISEVDALCAIWARTRDERLGRLLAERRYIATAPPEICILSALKARDATLSDRLAGKLVGHVTRALDDPDDDVRAHAAMVLANLKNTAAIDHLCATWARTRAERLGRLIAEHHYVASAPGPVQILSTLKCGSLVSIGDTEALDTVAGLLADPDEMVRRGAERSLEGVARGGAMEALCTLAIRDPAGPAARLCVQNGFRPADPEDACLFLLVTGQIDAYLAEDFEFQNLRLAYDRAEGSVREQILRVLRSGDRRLSGFLGKRKPLSHCTAEEIETALSSWIRHADWERVLQACVSLPWENGLQGWRSLCHSNWDPTSDDMRSLLRAARDALAATGSEAAPGSQLGSQASVSAPGRPSQKMMTTPELPIWVAKRGIGQPIVPRLKHGGPVNHAAFSPDGTRVVTASDDGTARVWDAATGKPVSPPLKHGGPVTHAAFSPDGTTVATASQDKTARLWDAATGAPRSPALEHEHRVDCAAFSPDGERLVTASWDKTARVWDAATGKPVSDPLRHDSHYVLHAAFSPDGTKVVTTSADKKARIWDAASWRPVSAPLAHDNWVRHAAFSPDGTRLVTASDDSKARVWDAATGRLIWQLPHDSPYVVRAAFSPDGKRVVTAGDDSKARIWDMATGQSLTPPLEHYGAVNSAEFSADGRKVVTASRNCTARVWDAARGWPISPRMAHAGPLASAKFSADGAQVVTASHDGSARVWDARTLDVAHLWPAAATPDDLESIAAAIAKISDARTAPVLRLVHELLARRAMPGTFEPVLVPAHEFAAEFEFVVGR
jgi:WD40 repeat protein